MSRHFALNSELTGAIAKRLPHAKNQLSTPGSFFNQFVTDIYIYIYTQTNNNRVLIVRIGNTNLFNVLPKHLEFIRYRLLCLVISEQ